MSPIQNRKVVVGGVALVAALGLGVLLRAWPEDNFAPAALGLGVLVLGFNAGLWVAFLAEVAAGLFTLVLLLNHWTSLDAAVAGWAVQVVCVLFPLPFVEDGQAEEREFERHRGPLARDRTGLRDSLEELRTRAQAAERRGRETDALFHAGREISKLLTLADTLEFSREVLHDTLDQNRPSACPAFVLMLVDEEHALYRVGVAEGLDGAQAQLFEHRFEENGLGQWLKKQTGSVLVASVAGEPGLKGIPLPPVVRSLLSVPLVILGQPIGWVVVFDLGESSLADRDFSNLRILCSQISIGLEKATLYDKLQRLSITDGLTGLTVHRHFQSRLDEELKRAERYREPLSLIMSDIDHFKRFNDTWGHLAGDAVLKAVAGVLQRGLGPSEMAVRYGGEEFVLVLPRHTKEMAQVRAEALREAVKALRVATDGDSLSVTISLGVAAFPDDAMTKIGLIDMADSALYQSKKNGRDRVTLASKPPTA